jgi:2-amino-4-hydroxy-6-hydroxymethyldihydropteridine diphosphokinase
MRYALALGSNRRHGRHGAPARVLAAATAALEAAGVTVVARAPVLHTVALGPAGRGFANGALLIETDLAPEALLGEIKAIERAFGRRRGRRWGARVLDLDILLWSGGTWRSRGLAIPHPALAGRRFVLDPLRRIAPDWRVAGAIAVRHLAARLTRARPTHRSGPRSGP